MVDGMSKNKSKKSAERRGRKKLPAGQVLVQLSFRTSPEIAEALERVATREDRTVSSQVNRAVRSYLVELGELPGYPL